MKFKNFLFLALIAGGIYSCSDAEQDFTEKKSSVYELTLKSGSTDEEKVKNAVLEMTEMMKNITTNYPSAYEELFFLFHSDFYIEPYVGLFELLDHENALIYKFVEVAPRLKGSFKTAFETELNAHPSLYVNLSEISKRRIGTTIINPGLEGLEKFFNEAGIAFYAPYILDRNDIEFELNDRPTLVPGVIDADSGLGYSLTKDGDWEDVITDDDYAEDHMTIIIEPNNYAPCDGSETSFAAPISTQLTANVGELVPCVGENYGYVPDEPEGNMYSGDCGKLEPTTENAFIRQVFIGHAKINNKQQYDAWISATGNGGGSEIRIGMLDSRDQIEIDSTGNILADKWDNIVNVEISRRAIRKGHKKWVGSIWHKNWECSGEKHEVLFGVYEEDTEGDIVFDQTIKFQDEEIFSIDATIQNRSKDEIIRKWTREKTEFFITNLLDQGGGYWTGEYSFSDRDWAIYDVGSDFSYTMPHRWVPVGNNINN